MEVVEVAAEVVVVVMAVTDDDGLWDSRQEPKSNTTTER